MLEIKISIIMPSFNSVKYIEKSIHKFNSQNYEHKELIIVDGKSTDGTHQILEKIKASNIIWIKEKDTGISDAINIGIHASSGEIIGYLGTDDLLCDGIFEKIAFFYSLNHFDIIYFDSYNYLVKLKKITYRKCPEVKFSRLNLIKYGTIVGLEDIFFKKDLIQGYKYNTENKYSMDYEMYLQIFSNYNPDILYVNIPATINIFDDNISELLVKQQTIEANNTALRFCRNFTERLLVYKRKNRFLSLLRIK